MTNDQHCHSCLVHDYHYHPELHDSSWSQHMMNIFQVNQSRFDEKISQILPHKTSNTCDDNILLTVSTSIKQLETKMLIWSWEVAPSCSRVEELFRECNIIQDPTRAAEQRFYVKTDTADRKLKTVLHLCVRQLDSDWGESTVVSFNFLTFSLCKECKSLQGEVGSEDWLLKFNSRHFLLTWI